MPFWKSQATESRSMKTHNIRGDRFGTLEISTKDEVWHVRASAHIAAEFFGIRAPLGSTGNEIIISGMIAAHDGVATEGDNIDVKIGRTAIVSAVSSGVSMSGQDSVVRNAGLIFAHQAIGLQVVGRSEAHNTGTIVANTGIAGRGDGFQLVNGENGTIEAQEVGFRSFGLLEDASGTIVNHGLVRVQANGVLGFSFFSLAETSDTIINDGRMTGHVVFGNGDDTLDIRGGFLKGNIFGESGNDTLITHNARYILTEDADRGFDTVKSTVTYALPANVEELRLLGSSKANGIGNSDANDIIGNSVRNVLRGLEGADILRGSRGNDTLFGGGADGAMDRFDFNTRNGHDVIADFEDGFDFVNLAGWKAIRDFNDLLNNHTRFVGGDTVIEAGPDQLRIRNLDSAEFDNLDVIFAP
jgi:Ca2+-binding RTX toxin-like protein